LCLAFFEGIELPKEEDAPVISTDVSFVPQMVSVEDEEDGSDETDEEDED
jgi:hypothetical protein